MRQQIGAIRQHRDLKHVIIARLRDRLDLKPAHRQTLAQLFR